MRTIYPDFMVELDANPITMVYPIAHEYQVDVVQQRCIQWVKSAERFDLKTVEAFSVIDSLSKIDWAQEVSWLSKTLGCTIGPCEIPVNSINQLQTTAPAA
jgi:hypothetical protein